MWGCLIGWRFKGITVFNTLYSVCHEPPNKDIHSRLLLDWIRKSTITPREHIMTWSNQLQCLEVPSWLACAPTESSSSSGHMGPWMLPWILHLRLGRRWPLHVGCRREAKETAERREGESGEREAQENRRASTGEEKRAVHAWRERERESEGEKQTRTSMDVE